MIQPTQKIRPFPCQYPFVHLFILLLIGLAATACSRAVPAAQVLIEDAENAFVRQIGELDVQRQEAVNAIEEARDEITRMKRLEAENAIEAEFLNEELAELQAEQLQMQLEMGKLADHIENEEPLTLSDETEVSVEELEAYASRRIEEFELLTAKIGIKEDTLAVYEQNVENAQQRREEAELLVAQLESQMELVDAQIANLRVYEEQPELLSEGGTEDVLVKAQELVDEMRKTLEVKTRVQERLSESGEEDIDAQIEDALNQDVETDKGDALLTKLRSLSNDADE